MDELSRTLFDACREGKVEVIKFIVNKNPSLITKKDAQKNTALHVACESGLSTDGIEFLCLAHLDALKMFNDEGASPFHLTCSCYHGKSVENLKILNEKLPIGIVTPNENGDLPIHWINGGASEELVSYLIEKFPQSVRVKNQDDVLPIHLACNKGLSLSVIHLLHKAHPVGILQSDKDGTLSIHDACQRSPNLDLVKFFHDVSPELFQMADKKGNLALHHAACSSSLEVVQFVMNAHKLALKKQNIRGYLPFHSACIQSTDVNVIKILHENHPEAVKTKTTKGLLPFHLAMTNLSALTCLYELHDEAIRFTDKKGRCAIEIANKRGAPIEVINFLREKHPMTTRVKAEERNSMHAKFKATERKENAAPEEVATDNDEDNIDGNDAERETAQMSSSTSKKKASSQETSSTASVEDSSVTNDKASPFPICEPTEHKAPGDSQSMPASEQINDANNRSDSNGNLRNKRPRTDDEGASKPEIIACQGPFFIEENEHCCHEDDDLALPQEEATDAESSSSAPRSWKLIETTHY